MDAFDSNMYVSLSVLFQGNGVKERGRGHVAVECGGIFVVNKSPVPQIGLCPCEKRKGEEKKKDFVFQIDVHLGNKSVYYDDCMAYTKDIAIYDIFKSVQVAEK